MTGAAAHPPAPIVPTGDDHTGDDHTGNDRTPDDDNFADDTAEERDVAR